MRIYRKGKKDKLKNIIMLFSMSFLPHQGRYLRVYNEAKTLIEAGKNVIIIAWDRECTEAKKEVIDGIKVERIWSRAGFQRGPGNIFNVLTFYARLLPKLFRKNADVIHCFNLDTILPGLVAAKLKRKKAVLDLCEPDYYANWPQIFSPLVRMIQAFERFFSKRFDYVLVHNRYQIKKFHAYGLKALEQIGSYPSRSLTVDKIRMKKDANNSVVIGRFGSIYKNNGIEEMIEAFMGIRNVFPNVSLMLAGKVFEEFRCEFDRLIAPLGDTVKVTGKFSPEDLPTLYDKIDISIQLSRKTDWFRNITPTKFFESLANGVPVVSSDIGNLREIIEECKCGVIVDETDPESVFSGLRRLVEDPDLRLKMAENGLQAIEQKYNWDLMTERLLDTYQILESPSSKISNV